MLDEPTVKTGPNDPAEVQVRMDENRRIAILAATFDDGRTVELTFSALRARHIGSLLQKCAAMYEQRLDDEVDAQMLLRELGREGKRPPAPPCPHAR